MGDKMQRKKLQKDDEFKLFQHQKADLKRWKQSQLEIEQEARSKVSQLADERNANLRETAQKKEEERQKSIADDLAIVSKAKAELEMENKRINDKKNRNRTQ